VAGGLKKKLLVWGLGEFCGGCRGCYINLALHVVVLVENVVCQMVPEVVLSSVRMRHEVVLMVPNAAKILAIGLECDGDGCGY
jgi:hypothetical protein